MSFYANLGVLVFGSRLRRLSEAFLSDLNKCYRSRGIHFDATWFPIFYILSQQETASIRDIADQLEVSHSAASQLVSNLQEKGLLKTTVDKQDARKKVVTLSAKGQKLLQQVEPVWKALQQAMESLLAEGENSSKMLAAIADTEQQMQERSLFERMEKHLK
ncbi:MarR family transcriptional regulator [Flavihumibacter rivuli]|uniref:MarR family winged helix-turn-helix transcriptional regulator n=1 Tax=Flavihumibacter rivuli TaxID=2838156 RepID=UPI001BDEB965|nr:MarR family transcriptional regulator [Flavihumibacter rivuli]ULQ57661.1 MarR family transcriptional regulator [Flavihumibacter rivuli]